MLKRIAVIGGGGLPEIESGEVQVLPVEAGQALPCGTSAVVSTLGPDKFFLEAALAVADGHAAALQLLADAIAVREGAPLGAEERVVAHATRFAEALGLSLDERSTLERAALLRDVGKLCVDNDILLKSAVLSYDDWLLIRRHTLLGAELLEARGLDTDILDIVRYHHECWDGDGYPENLEGEAIPRLARVMKIIDVYCAMTTPRHYREKANSHEDALAYLESERGKHYDPELMDIFLGQSVGQPT